MSDDDKFYRVLKSTLHDLAPGQPTRAAANDALTQYIVKLRRIAATPNGPKVRAPQLAAADDELLGELTGLLDTEHDGQEHVQQPAEEQAPTVADLPEIPMSEPDLPEIPPSEPDLPEIPPSTPEPEVQQSRKKKR